MRRVCLIHIVTMRKNNALRKLKNSIINTWTVKVYSRLVYDSDISIQTNVLKKIRNFNFKHVGSNYQVYYG